MLKVAPRRGLYVEDFDQTRFKQTMDVRIALECMAVELATKRIPTQEILDAREVYRCGGEHYQRTGNLSKLAQCDNLLHDLIISHSENPLLINIMGQLQDLISWAHHIVAKLQPDANLDALPEHLAILDRLIEREVAATQAAMRNHLQKTMQRTLRAWDQKPIEGM